MDELKEKMEATAELVKRIFGDLNIAIVVEDEEGVGRCVLGIKPDENPMVFVKRMRVMLDRLETAYIAQQN